MSPEESGVRKVLAMWKVRTSTLTRCRLLRTSDLFRRLRTLASLKEIPSACRDALTFTVTHRRRGDLGDGAGASCGGSVCVVTREAHRIELRIVRDGTLFAADSVYVPAVGESECRSHGVTLPAGLMRRHPEA